MKFINIIFSVLLVLVYTFFTYLLYDIGILSGTFEYILLFILTVIVILMVLGILKAGKKLKIVSYVFSILLLIILSTLIYYLNTTKYFIDSFDGESKDNYDNYYVIVLKNSKYLKLSDLKDKKIAVSSNLDDTVLDKINLKFEKAEYDDCEKLKNSLFNKDVDGVILSDVDEFLLKNIDSTFEDNIRVLYKIKVKKESENETIEQASDIDITKTPFVVFISGIDTSGAISKVSRSDVNIVVTVNPVSHEVLLTTIPRDYYVQLNGTTGYKDKLTHAGIYGVSKSVKTVEDLLDIDISYYLRVNFDSVVKLVDEIGGVNIYSDRNLSFCNIKQGYNYLDGNCALRFARERHSYETGDRHRGENQEEVIKAIIDKVSTSSAILTKYNAILKNLQNSFESDVNSSTIKSYLRMQIKDMPKWSVKTYNLNGYDSHNYTYSYRGSKLYVMEPDVNTVSKASSIINGMLDKKTFSELGI